MRYTNMKSFFKLIFLFTFRAQRFNTLAQTKSGELYAEDEAILLL